MATIDYKEKYEQALERARQFIEKPYLERTYKYKICSPTPACLKTL